ncbi:single-stranded DNA-binding protein [Candidatus Peregrinibacteria bacterium]|nr:single-stranded DNA-binding protein [Candidatus Peregrinibacteria bacterium]
MRSVNKVILIGNLTRDPELKLTPSNQAVATFGLATNREWMTRDKSKKGSTEFHELVAWARLAEICHKNLKKGKLIYIEGYLKTRNWDTPEGIKKFKTEVIVQDMIILEKRPKEQENEITSSSEGETLFEEEYESISMDNEENHESNDDKKLNIDSDLGL